MSDLPAMLSDYLSAVRHARAQTGVSFGSSVGSVLTARLRYGLGPRMHSLFRLYAHPSKEWPDYIVDETLRKHLRILNPGSERPVLNDKYAFFAHCEKHALPTIPVIATVPGRKSPGGESQDAARSRFCKALDRCEGDVFIKLRAGTWGRNAFRARRLNANTWSFAGREGTPDGIYQHCLAHGETALGWIVQPCIQAHPALRNISSPHGLPTIRAITLLDSDSGVLLAGAVLRIPTGSNVTDNFAHGQSGNLLAPVDIDSGRLGKAVGSSDRSWPRIQTFPTHPDTGRHIEGTELPDWEAARTLLERAQSSLPALRTVGWDITLTTDGPVLVEGNGTYDVDLLQVAHDRGVGRTLEPFIHRALGEQSKGAEQ